MNFKKLTKITDSVSASLLNGITKENVESIIDQPFWTYVNDVLALVDECTPYSIRYVRVGIGGGHLNDYRVTLYCYHSKDDRRDDPLLQVSTYWYNGVFKDCEVSGENEGRLSYFKEELHAFYRERADDVFYESAKNLCGVRSYEEKLSVPVIVKRDYKPYKEEIWEGTLGEIFNKMNDANEELKYINGSSYEFKDDSYRKLYRKWCSMKGTGYFISRAASHGATID